MYGWEYGEGEAGKCVDEMGRVDRWRLIGGGGGLGMAESHIKIHTCTYHTPTCDCRLGQP